MTICTYTLRQSATLLAAKSTKWRLVAGKNPRELSNQGIFKPCLIMLGQSTYFYVFSYLDQLECIWWVDRLNHLQVAQHFSYTISQQVGCCFTNFHGWIPIPIPYEASCSHWSPWSPLNPPRRPWISNNPQTPMKSSVNPTSRTSMAVLPWKFSPNQSPNEIYEIPSTSGKKTITI